MIGAGKEAVLEYEVLDSGVWDMYHTEVPEEYRGQGLAGQLAKVSSLYSAHMHTHTHTHTHRYRLAPTNFQLWHKVFVGGCCGFAGMCVCMCVCVEVRVLLEYSCMHTRIDRKGGTLTDSQELDHRGRLSQVKCLITSSGINQRSSPYYEPTHLKVG